MDQIINDNNRWTRTEKLSVLSIILSFFLSLLQYLPFLTKIILGLSLKLDLPLSTTRLLIALTLFVILTLILSLIFIFKNKHSHLPNQKNNTYPLPINIMNEILLLIKETDNFNIAITKHKMKYTNEKLRTYLGILVSENYISSPKKITHNDEPLFKTYKLNAKGYNYLIYKSLI
jgi:hypothetical protein